MKTKDNSQVAAAGEHFVAYYLSRRGYAAALTRGGSQSIDLLVGNQNGTRSVSLQIKTASDATRKSRWEWIVGHRARLVESDSFFYVFVDLRKKAEAIPEVYVVPSKDVNRQMNEQAKPHPWFYLNSSNYGQYKDNWEPVDSILKNAPPA